MLRLPTLLLTLVCLCLVPMTLPAADRETDPDALFLKANGIGPDPAGLLAYLRSMRPGDEQKREILRLIEQLGSRRFQTRSEAARRLTSLAVVAIPELQEATRSADLEVRRRATEILARVEKVSRPLLIAAVRLVGKRKTPGAAPVLLELLASFPEGYTQRLLREALWQASGAEDGKVLRGAIDSGKPEIRAVALVACERALGRRVLPVARKHLTDREEMVRLAAARVVALHEPRECLGALAGLLNAESLPVRADSVTLLRAITGQRFDYAAHDEPASRAGAVVRWKEWIEKNGKTAKLILAPRKLDSRLGRTLLCLFDPYRVRELDTAGKTVFSTDALASACGCQGMANGHRVFADWGGKEVIELDAQGKVCWRKPVPGTPNCLHRLPNGNVVVGLFTERKVIEIDRDGKVVWQANVPGEPTESQRLENGRTLVALYETDQLVELNRTGKVVWQVRNVLQPESARRLGNGNTLVASSSGQVREYDRSGKVVWSAQNLPRAYDALELDNGNILIGYSKGLREMTRQGKVVREMAVGTVRRISRY
jgi:HEAT repeat protein